MAKKRSLEKSAKKGVDGSEEQEPVAECSTSQKKQLPETESQEIGGSGDSKRQKLDVTKDVSRCLCASPVQIFNTTSNADGVYALETYKCQPGDEVDSIQNIQLLLDKQEGSLLRMGNSRAYYLYPAFKEALSRLLTAIEHVITDENNEIMMILVHGVPNIGKSTLAQCLAYYLSLFAGRPSRHETVQLLRLGHSSKVDSYALTDHIMTTFSQDYLILDQVNTNALEFLNLFQCLHNKYLSNCNSVPLIAFTSGHYAPGKSWLDGLTTGWLCYKVIQMQVDVALVGKLKKELKIPEKDSVSNENLLEVTTIYQRMYSCLVHLKTNPPASKTILRNMIFPRAEVDYMGKEQITAFIWVAWHELLSGGLPSRTEFTDDLCMMRPHLLEFLGYLISQIKDPSDKGINALLNQMDITGTAVFERNNYKEFHPDSYFYIFLNKNPLYDVLKATFDFHSSLNAAQRRKVIVDAIKLLQSRGKHLNYASGGLFESFILFHCEAEKERKGYEVGMTEYGSSIDFVTVDYFFRTSMINELCNLPLHTKSCSKDLARLFVVLNVPGKRAFKGYDFAYMDVNHSGGKIFVQRMELFQVTVNPDSKTNEQKMIMADVITLIREELVKLKLIKNSGVENVVLPFFVSLKSSDESDDSEDYALPGKRKPIPCKVLSFPRKLFEL